MKLNVANKEYNIKFGYEATVKSKIIKRMQAIGTASENQTASDSMEQVDEMLKFIPEFLLVGLQKNHREEFSYDYDTENGKEAALEKVYGIIDAYFDQQSDNEDEQPDLFKLFTNLQNELLENGFLASLFRQQAKTTGQKKK